MVAENLDFFFRSFMSIFIIMSPFSVIPIFISITQNNTKEEKSRIIKKAILTSAGLCLFFAFMGQYLFKIFGFSIDSFKVAGGTLLFLMSINMLHAKRSRARITESERQEGIDKEDVSIFPLAIPIITGPGTISTVVLLAGSAANIFQTLFLVLAVLLSSTVIFLLLRVSRKLYRLMGETGVNILTRIMGLILASISIEFIFHGIKNYFSIG